MTNLPHTFCVPIPHDESPIDISVTMDASLLDLHDNDLSANEPVTVQGTVSCVDGYIMLSACISTSLISPCSMCAEDTVVDINIPNWSHAQELATLPHAESWDLTDALRETVVVEAPFFPLCGRSICRNIDQIRTFIRSEDKCSQEDSVYQPFRDLL